MISKISGVLFVFTIIALNTFGQTWVRTYNIEYLLPAMHQDTATVGPHSLCISPNGTVFTLMQVDQAHNDWLAAIDSSGNLLWNRYAGYHGGIYFEEPYSLHPTIDNGCIYGIKHQGSYIGDSIYRLNSSGNVLWKKSYSGQLGYLHTVLSLSETFYNTTLIQFLDSLVEFDSTGNYIRSRALSSFYATITCLPDSNIIRCDTGIVTKEDFNGNQFWNYNTGINIIEVSPCLTDSFMSQLIMTYSKLIRQMEI
jgi:hypothetical protein